MDKGTYNIRTYVAGGMSEFLLKPFGHCKNIKQCIIVTSALYAWCLHTYVLYVCLCAVY